MSFYEEIFKLKQLVRRGWILRNIDGRRESDAEHTFSMIMLAERIMSKNKLKLDELKVLKMIAFHELCEIDAGDVTPVDNVSKEQKFNKEYDCIKRLSKEFEMPEIQSLWLEFEENKTDEAKFVKKIDKFDAIMQAKIYSKEQNRPEVFDEFYNNSKEIFDEMEKLL